MTTNTYGTGASYAFGQVVSSTSDTYTNNGNSTSGSPDSETSTTNTYIWRGGPLLSTITYDEDTTDSGSTDRVTTNTYSTLSALTNADIADGRARDADYITDHSGQVIRRDETDGKTSGTNYGDPHEVWHRFGGKQMGYVGNNGTTNTDYEASIADRTTTPDSNHTTQGAFRHGEHQSDPYSDFDQSYDRINSYNQGATAGTYTVRGGETLASIAAGLYGDSNLWYKIAEANGLSASSNLTTGTTLRLPAGVIRNTNSAGTFTPYNPGDAIGDVSPTAPEPPKDANNCGVFGAVVLVIVAVVVTAITKDLNLGAKLIKGASTLAKGAAAVVTAASAGAAGSAASQAVGVATGIQEKFSWNSVALSALSAGVTQGIGGDGGLNVFKGVSNSALKSGLEAATANAITQGIGSVTGLQDKFSFAGVAAAGVGAAAGSAFGGTNFVKGIGNRHIAGAVVGTASAIANAATRSAIDGSNFDDNIIAAIPDVIGQAIGGAVAGEIIGAVQPKIPPVGDTPVNMTTKIPNVGVSGGNYAATTGAYWASQNELVVMGQKGYSLDAAIYKSNGVQQYHRNKERASSQAILRRQAVNDGLAYQNQQAAIIQSYYDYRDSGGLKISGPEGWLKGYNQTDWLTRESGFEIKSNSLYTHFEDRGVNGSIYYNGLGRPPQIRIPSWEDGSTFLGGSNITVRVTGGESVASAVIDPFAARGYVTAGINIAEDGVKHATAKYALKSARKKAVKEGLKAAIGGNWPLKVEIQKFNDAKLDNFELVGEYFVGRKPTTFKLPESGSYVIFVEPINSPQYINFTVDITAYRPYNPKHDKIITKQATTALKPYRQEPLIFLANPNLR